MRAAGQRWRGDRGGQSAAVLVLLALLAWSSVAQAGGGRVVPEADAKAYRQARTILERDAEAAYKLAASIDKLPYAEDKRLDLMAQTALRSGRGKEAVRHFLAFAQETTDAQARFVARLSAAELLALLGSLREADDLLRELDRERSSLRGRYATINHLSARVLRMRHDIALAQARQGDKGRMSYARAYAEQLLKYLPNESATRREGLAMKPEELSDSDRFRRGIAFYGVWAYQDARVEFRRFEKEDSSRGESARWHLAQIALNKIRDDFKEAERLFGELRKGGKYANESTYQYARSLMRQERYKEALDIFDEYEERFPRGRRIELVYYYRGWLPYDRRDNDAAIAGFKRYLDRYTRGGSRKSYVRGFLAWTYMRKGAWREAIEAYDELYRYGNPLVEGKALYWQAHAHHQLKEKKQALGKLNRLRQRYPLTYYGMLGEQLRAKIQGKDQRASKAWWPEGSGTYPTTPAMDVQGFDEDTFPSSTAQQFKRVKALVALGERDDAQDALSPIYNATLRAIPSDQRDAWIQSLGMYVGDYNRMWRVATGGTISRLLPVPDRDKLRSAMGYPQAYPEVSKKVADEFGLPVYLIWSIMRQESRYKPGAISHTDAVGALQMIPATARLVARDMGTEYNLRTFHIPEVGFRFSAFYMKKLLNTFDGLFVAMASSYNTGPFYIARWFKRNPKASFPWLIEEFEYNEGRNYGRKVAEHMTRYLYLYERDAKRRGEILDMIYPLSRDITIPEDVGY